MERCYKKADNFGLKATPMLYTIQKQCLSCPFQYVRKAWNNQAYPYVWYTGSKTAFNTEATFALQD